MEFIKLLHQRMQLVFDVPYLFHNSCFTRLVSLGKYLDQLLKWHLADFQPFTIWIINFGVPVFGGIFRAFINPSKPGLHPNVFTFVKGRLVKCNQCQRDDENNPHAISIKLGVMLIR